MSVIHISLITKRRVFISDKKVTSWVSVGGCQIFRRKHRRILTEIQISDGNFERKCFRRKIWRVSIGFCRNTMEIPSEFQGPVLKKFQIWILIVQVGMCSFNFNCEERERELRRERGSKKEKKEGDFHGFRWPMTGKNSCRHL